MSGMSLGVYMIIFPRSSFILSLFDEAWVCNIPFYFVKHFLASLDVQLEFEGMKNIML